MQHTQRALARLCAVLVPCGLALAQSSFVNYENPHVHPLERTPDGTRLIAVNTPDNRIEVFDLTGVRVFPQFSVPVGLDPVSVRARSATEVWVVNHVSDSISIVDLSTGNVVRTLATDDEPADVVFTSSPARAFVSCSQANSVLVFDLANLAAVPQRIAIVGEEPRALAVDATGSKVYAAIFESGNRSTVLGGGLAVSGTLSFPPNVVSDPSGPYGGLNPPPNNGAQFDPPLNGASGTPPRVSLIVKQDGAGRWRDDNGTDWTDFVSGSSAALSGRPIGWSLADHDIAVIDSASLSVGYASGLMNICMALAVHPTSGAITVVGTDGTNEVRFEPKVNGTFVRVELARVDATTQLSLGTSDLNPHLGYASATVPQSERDKSLGDPRAILWRADGSRGYVSGMGSNNVIVIDALGQRAGLAPTIEVGEGPTGLALDEARGKLYVLDKFESALSIVDLALEREVARVPFHDPSPAAIKLGRKHLYDTHKNSGLGQAACASCHVDARLDRLAWDLGDPSGALKQTTGQNLGANIPGLNTGFQPWHPMKGPMTTQTLQDIVAHEPLHWRGDRAGLEEFNGAFVGLQGDDTNLTPTEMQQFEDFLATITYPPNPYRNFDNTLPTNLPLPGHFTTGRFAPAGQALPNGNAIAGLAAYRPPSFLDGGNLACVTCHTLPTGMGTDYRLQGAALVPIAPGPSGEHHRALVSVDGTTNVSTKIPQLRNIYEKTGFNTTQLVNTAGFGYLHDGSVDSIERFLAEPAFDVTSDQMVANLTAFMLAFSGSELPVGSTNPLNAEPPGGTSKDSHAAVGAQRTFSAPANAADQAWINQVIGFANANKTGLVVKGRQGGLTRGYAWVPGSNLFQSDRAAQSSSASALWAAAGGGNELTFTVVPRGSQTRIGIDRDLDGTFDRDELDLGTDPADAASHPGGCLELTPLVPSGLVTTTLGANAIHLAWTDNASNEQGFTVERAPLGSGAFAVVATLGADVTSFRDSSIACESAYDYRVSAFNCAGSSGFAISLGLGGSCCSNAVTYCTAKTNSLGCVPFIGASGQASASATSGFLVVGAQMRNLKPGLLFYGFSGRAAAPFQAGTMCVAAPRFRGITSSSNGNAAPADDCSGRFALDLNAFASGALGGNPMPGLRVVGSVVNCQWWGRDTGFAPPNNTTLSDALEFTICP
ncbi:MAG: beta-propeller fold lactonase family protein [Planctomycetes bacterium]|nr:beta-propeller fold lactonase family protein [Planctomycetota bacterium]